MPLPNSGIEESSKGRCHFFDEQKHWSSLDSFRNKPVTDAHAYVCFATEECRKAMQKLMHIKHLFAMFPCSAVPNGATSGSSLLTDKESSGYQAAVAKKIQTETTLWLCSDSKQKYFWTFLYVLMLYNKWKHCRRNWPKFKWQLPTSIRYRK